MKGVLKLFLMVLLTGIILNSAAIAGEGLLDGISFSGKTYFDFSRDISKDGPRADGQYSEFMFRRAYFTFNKKIDETFSLRFRTDADRKSDVAPKKGYYLDGDTTLQSFADLKDRDGKMRPFVKHAYLEWKNLLPNSKFYVGISGTPTWGISEKIWGYRGFRKTVLDNYKDATGVSPSASSADVGVALKGTIANKLFGYHAMIGNGAHYSKPENDKYKKFYLSVTANPSNFTIEGYVDYEKKDTDNANTTYKGLVGFMNKKFAVGTEYFIYDAQNKDVTMSAFSIFGRVNVTEKTTALARFDMYDPDKDNDDTETNLFVAGFDYKPVKGIHVIPNVYYFMNSKGYDAEEDPDIMGKVTFIWQFK